MIELSGHAQEQMERKGISQREVEECVKLGRLVSKQVIEGEMRYARTMPLKDKTVTVVYTLRGDRVRVITCYPIKRKRWKI
ncbi:MAG: DUF4258 domain-containing protein [Candidatus Aenigmarchaeota archaeon]|nr:DUF4258 domain-containing protein [Candidatus Aenigmarchaeota archaeon]